MDEAAAEDTVAAAVGGVGGVGAPEAVEKTEVAEAAEDTAEVAAEVAEVAEVAEAEVAEDTAARVETGREQRPTWKKARKKAERDRARPAAGPRQTTWVAAFARGGRRSWRRQRCRDRATD